MFVLYNKVPTKSFVNMLLSSCCRIFSEKKKHFQRYITSMHVIYIVIITFNAKKASSNTFASTFIVLLMKIKCGQFRFKNFLFFPAKNIQKLKDLLIAIFTINVLRCVAGHLQSQRKIQKYLYITFFSYIIQFAFEKTMFSIYDVSTITTYSLQKVL